MIEGSFPWTVEHVGTYVVVWSVLLLVLWFTFGGD